jgi:glucose/arabinose dehydrogenase
LYCGDVGQNAWEETDIIEKGKNYGWRLMEGTHCYNPSSGCKTEGLTLPIDEYSHETGISICGGYMYRGQQFPSLHGHYIFGDWNGKMFYLKQDKDRTWKRGEVYVDGSDSNDIDAKLNSMGEDENGEIYVITQHLFGPRSPTGAVYQLTF